jgi:hypothetical protein
MQSIGLRLDHPAVRALSAAGVCKVRDNLSHQARKVRCAHGARLIPGVFFFGH